jgi:flagellar hook-basal body complex protein FliE
MMQINSIDSLNQSFATQWAQFGQARGVGLGPVADGGPSFGSAIRSAIEGLDRQQLGAEREVARTVAGDSPDLHRTIAALQTADLSFQLGLQVRNKIIGAYEEIMRMQV